MTAIAYRYYRLLVSEVQRANYYLGIEEFRLYESQSNLEVNLALTAIVTARTSFNSGSNPPSNVRDGNRSTWWASAQMTNGVDEWLKMDLTIPKIVRRFEIYSTFNTQELPKKYMLQASNNNIDWTTVYKESGATVDPILRNISYVKVSGSSKNNTGTSNPRVLVTRWDTGELIEAVVPDSNGDFYCYPQTEDLLMVTHVGPTGCQPISDGPITPYE